MSIRKWWARRRFLRRLEKEGLLVGAGPCEGPTSQDEPIEARCGDRGKYPVVALPTSRWFVCDADGWRGHFVAGQGAEIGHEMATRETAPGGYDAADHAEMQERLGNNMLLWASAVVVTDTGGWLIFRAENAGRCEHLGDPRHAAWSGARGFYPLRLVSKKAPHHGRIMVGLDDAGRNLARRFNEASLHAAVTLKGSWSELPWLDGAWRSR